MLSKSQLLLAGALSLASAIPTSNVARTSGIDLSGVAGMIGSSLPACKCVCPSSPVSGLRSNTVSQAPDDKCWPSNGIWNLFNYTVSGNLIATSPIAASCYPGPQQDAAQCKYVDDNWSDAYYQISNPVGLSYPVNITCPPVNATAGETPGTCSIGTNPRYAVDARNNAQVAATIAFAELFNVRLVIKATGHDILGRSDGYGSLELWLHNYRQGSTFQKTFKSAAGCSSCGWTGSSIVINGPGAQWTDVYSVAQANNVIVVGGGTPSVGAMGGWMQGGGHGPASHAFGLGADQVLEAQVVLWNGTVVTANACQNTDIFFAIRGGGPGSYGVVVSTTIKAWPNVKSVQVQHLAIGALTTNTSSLLDAVTAIWSTAPDWMDAGFAGYGSWSVASPTPLFSTFTAGYVHGIYMFNATAEQAQAAWTTTRAKLAAYNDTLFISETYVNYTDYWTFYNAESGVEPPVGTTSALGSRLMSRDSVQKDVAGLRTMVGAIAGEPAQYTSNNVEYVGGGAVLKADPTSAVLPAWRKAYFNNIVARGWAPGTEQAIQDATYYDITYNKIAAMKKQAPDTGAYMNEADRHDPEYQSQFYGANYAKLLSIKQKYDPLAVFYCPTCVGSSAYKEDATGRLCKA